MDDRDSMRWAWRGVALAALLVGWVFIAWQNHFHVSAPLVFVDLGYLAVVATVYNLWRVGASVVAEDSAEEDSTWGKPVGELGELERERRTLLKAIKEAEFDQQMGKLSQRDADDMVHTYKARIYEVYAAIDKLQLGEAGSKREAILREVKARLEVDARSKGKASGKAEKAGKAKGKKADADAKADAKSEKAEGKADAEAAADAKAEKGDAAAESKAKKADAKDADVKDADAAAADAKAKDADADDADGAEDAAEPSASATPSVSTVLDDDALEADSTTALEPRVEPVPNDTSKRAAKEATP